MPRILTLTAASAVAVAAVILPVSPASNAAVVERTTAASKVKTPFAMKANGYGTRIDGGSIPAGSGTTAYQVIGCTNKAPIARRNDVASVTVPGVGIVEGVRTRNNTFFNAKRGKTTVVSTHDVARVELGPLVLRGVSSTAMAWHDRKGFHRKVASDLLSITAEGQSFPVPAPGQTLRIPGLATITLGEDRGFVNQKVGAYASANAVKVVLEPSGTVVRIAHSSAQIYRGLEVGRFRGQAFGTQVHAADENIRSGPQPLSYLPCQGTQGKIRTKNIAGLDLEEQIVVGAVENEVMGRTAGSGTRKRATGFTQSRIARVTLGPLTVNAIKARANVTRFRNGKLVRNAQGTTLGEIVVDGEPQSIPDPGESLEIPGLLKLEAHIVERIKNGIKVTALRLTLLDGTGAVVNLGNTRMEIKPSGAGR